MEQPSSQNINPNNAFHPYGAQGAPRVNADVQHKMKNKKHIGITVLVLLLAGCTGKDGPLHDAVQRRDLTTVKAKVEQGAAINASGMYGRTPLYYAALCGDSNIVAYLLSKGANPKKGASWKDYDTPLHIAADHGHIDCVQALLAAGVPVDIRNSAKQTPLHDAARSRHPDVVKLLLDHGANVNAIDKMGTTPLEYPSGANLKNSNSNYLEIVTILLEHGANVRHIDNNGETALHEALYIGNAQVVELLLEHGADPNIPGRVLSPLKWARKYGNANLEALLIKYGAKE